MRKRPNCVCRVRQWRAIIRSRYRCTPRYCLCCWLTRDGTTLLLRNCRWSDDANYAPRNCKKILVNRDDVALTERCQSNNWRNGKVEASTGSHLSTTRHFSRLVQFHFSSQNANMAHTPWAKLWKWISYRKWKQSQVAGRRSPASMVAGVDHEKLKFAACSLVYFSILYDSAFRCSDRRAQTEFIL